jgi:hypothetical protein
LAKVIIERCERAGITHEIDQNAGSLDVYLPAGKRKRLVYLADYKETSGFAELQFERYRFVEGYESICCYEDGFIEAYVRTILKVSANFVLRHLLNEPYSASKKSEQLTVELKHQTTKGATVSITIGKPSRTISLLTGRDEESTSDLTLTILGVSISSMDEAVRALEKLANSCFFEIRNNLGQVLMLEPYQEGVRAPVFRTKPKSYPIDFPKYEYDLEPLTLYWYAASAYKLPLLQFLAYYQVLEFYFPLYSNAEVQSAVTNIIKDSTFDPNDPLDISKLVSVVIARSGRSYGGEKEQLRATIRACVQVEEVRKLCESEAVRKYLKDNCRKLSPKKVSVDNKDLDLRDQLAERIYDIRCAIVHTKSEETQRQTILPFTEEESLLRVEVTILEFLARKALQAASKKLSLHGLL